MKPTRIGKPYTVTDQGKQVTLTYVWFPDGSRECMKPARLAWTLIYGKPPKGSVVYFDNGTPVCKVRKERLKEIGQVKGETKSKGARAGHVSRRWKKKAEATRIYLDHKPYPLAA